MLTIADLKDILDKKDRRMEIIKNELLEVKDKYGDERRSTIEYACSKGIIWAFFPIWESTNSTLLSQADLLLILDGRTIHQQNIYPSH